MLIQGGAIIPLLNDGMVHYTDPGVSWVTLIPAENVEAFPWRERHVRIMHDMQIGTVDELVQDFREKLERAFHLFSCSSPDGTHGVIPSFGEASLRKQTEVLERNNLNGDHTKDGFLFKADLKAIQARQDRRDNANGYKTRLHGMDRDQLMRLVATWGNRRHGGGSGSSPTDNPRCINDLIKALETLRDDHYRTLDIAYVKKNGITRDSLCELAKEFAKRHGRDPESITLTPEQLDAVRQFGDFAGEAGQEAAPLSVLGMIVKEGEVGPILE